MDCSDRKQLAARSRSTHGRIGRAAPIVLAVIAVAAALLGFIVLFPWGNSAAADGPQPPTPRGNPLRSGSGTTADASSGQSKPAPSTARPSKSGNPKAEKSDDAAADSADPEKAAPGDHPLDPALAMAEKVLAHIKKDVKDYTCVMVKQERIEGKLKDPEYMSVKMRQDPFSVYLKFLKPAEIKGREVLYVAKAHDGQMLVREPGGFRRLLGVIPLKPDGPLAMEGQRYPITDMGLAHLTERLIEIAKHDRQYGEVEVHFFKNAKVNDRVCTLIEVTHPTKRKAFLFHKAQIYIDDELNLPICYQAFLWPKEKDGEPPLDESYSYLNLKVNVDLTDADFDPHNAKYGFYGP